MLKLGGSVITQKDRAETLDGAALDAAADAVAAALEAGTVDRLVLVHGAGSFGHHHASEHGVTTTEGTTDAGAVTAIHGAMTTLNQFVRARLRERGVPVVPVHPLSAASRDADGELTLSGEPTRTLLSEGFVPVLHGDGVAQTGSGVTILSGDEVVVRLSEALSADRVGLCSSVPGVLDDDESVIDRIDDFDAVASALGASDATDVSGGMAAKVRELLALDAPAHVFGPDALEAFLAGDDVGTRVE
ncbi:isopentenyl phosphate kinase [Halobaculum sp. MBLA0147]|uniref:isopentenyl phosphate kinase n=1 Tax=Halobaculum sp. MBLA0147 TaxID=3079934 RepID=UPI003525B921